MAKQKKTSNKPPKKNSGKKVRRKKAPAKKMVSRKQLVLALGAVALVILIAYLPVLNAGFVDIDDQKLILNRGPLFKENPWATLKFVNPSPHYKPVTYFTWMLEYRAVGDKPFLYHFNNLLLHIFNSLLIFVIARRLSKQFARTKGFEFEIGIASAILFGLHPMHVESVAWVVERKDVLYTFFFLSSLFSYTNYLNKGDKLQLALSAACYLLSVFSKSPGITLIAVLFLFDFAWNRKLSPKLFIEKVGHFVVLAIALYALGFFRGAGEGSISAMTSDKVLARSENIQKLPKFYGKIVLASIRGWFWYFHSIFPFRLSLGYPREALLGFLGPFVHLFLPMLLGAAGFLLYNARRYRLLFFAHVFFFLTLLPAMVRLGLGIGIFMSDRYVYLSVFGLIFLFAAWILTIKDSKLRREMRFGIIGAIVFLFGILTFNGARVWHSTETLWTNVIDKYPKVPYAHVNRGSYYREQGEYDKGLSDLNNGIELDQTANAYIQRGLILRQSGRAQEALADYNAALEKEPDNIQALVNRGNALLDLQRFREAIVDYELVLSESTNVRAGVNLAIAYASLGDFANAQKSFQSVERQAIAQNSKDFFLNRAIMSVELGQFENALSDYTTYLQINPGDHQIYNDRGIVLATLGRHQEAVQSFTTAINISPVKMYFTGRARSYEALGNTAAAQADRQRAR